LAEDNVLLRVVFNDLDYLHKNWDQTIEENSLRVTSTILRRLLVDGVLQRAWKAAGFEREPRITAHSLMPHLRFMEGISQKILLGWAGGARVKGAQLGTMSITGKYLSDEETKAFSAIMDSQEILPLSAFIAAPSIVVNGEVVPRRVVIKYIVNTQGGAHVGAEKRINDAERRQYRRLDEARNSQGGQYPVPFFELLSIGQALVGAEDLTRLREKISQMLRLDPGQSPGTANRE